MRIGCAALAAALVCTTVLAAETHVAMVLRVEDGRTLLLLVEDARMAVRLKDVDAPKEGEEGHVEARDALKLEHPPGSKVTLTIHGRDEMGGILGSVEKWQPDAADAQGQAAKSKDAEKPRALVEAAPLGDVSVAILGAWHGPVPLLEGITGRASVSENHLLGVIIQVANRSEARKVDYATWSAQWNYLQNTEFATLKDEHGNDYKAVHFGMNVAVAKQRKAASIYPGKVIVDTLVFEPPVKVARKLTITFPGGNVGIPDESLALSLPASKIANW